MAGIDNLTPFKKGEQRAKDAQLIGASVKHKRAEQRAILRNSFVEILNGKMEVSDVMRNGASMIGVKLGKKEAFGKVLMLTLTQESLKKKNWKAIVELAKLAGLSFDQSEDGLGGENNPVNITNAVKVSPENVKKISEALEGEC